MDFKDLFIALAVVAIGMFAFMGLASDFNNQYGTSIGAEFQEDYDELHVGIIGNLSEQGSTTAASGFEEAGQSSGDADESISRRALRIMSTIPQLIGLPGKLIQTAGAHLGVPTFITQLAQWSFNFVFILTLAYLFITGSRRLIGR